MTAPAPAAPKLTARQRRTLALYEALIEEREQGIAERRAQAAEAGTESGEGRGPGGAENAPLRRLRFARDPKTGRPAIDLSKADPACERCGGTGRLADKLLDDPEGEGVLRVPVVCVCVHRGGGVARDALDRLLDKAAKGARWAERRRARRRERAKARKAKQRKRRS